MSFVDSVKAFFAPVIAKLRTSFLPFLKTEAEKELAAFEKFCVDNAGLALQVVETVALNPALVTPEAKLAAATALLAAELSKRAVVAGTAAVQTLIQDAVVTYKLNTNQPLLSK